VASAARLQDLRDGGGLGFTVENFFLALTQLLSGQLSTSFIKGIPLCAGRAQKLLLEIALSHSSFDFVYPAYIVDEL